jgi:hypothetical protein
MANVGRKTQYQAIHEISAQFTSGSAVSGLLGTLPAGCLLGVMHLWAGTAFNSTTNTLSIGTTPGGTQITAAFDLKTAPARSDVAVPMPTAGPFGVDTPIYYTLGSTGPAPTAGLAIACLDYLPGAG